MVKVSVIHVQCLKWPYLVADGMKWCAFAMPAKMFLSNSQMLVQVRFVVVCLLFNRMIFDLIFSDFHTCNVQFNYNNNKDVLTETSNNSVGSKRDNDDGGTGAGGGNGNSSDEQDVLVRKYGEVLINTLSTVASVLEYPKGLIVRFRCYFKCLYYFLSFFSDLIKDSARPSYWVPDIESPDCCVCKLPFGTAEELTMNMGTGSSPLRGGGQRAAVCNRTRHHCRACGLAVCNVCSMGRRPVPERGWITDVRVCDHCNKKSKCD